MSDENSLTDGGVPEEFWSVPENFISDHGLRLLHADTCRRLRDDNPEADTLEVMAIERIASLYFYMRSKEIQGNFGSDTAYKGMMSLWVSMASDLRKSRLGGADEATVRRDVLRQVVSAVNGAFNGMEPEVAKTIKARIAERLEQV